MFLICNLFDYFSFRDKNNKVINFLFLINSPYRLIDSSLEEMNETILDTTNNNFDYNEENADPNKFENPLKKINSNSRISKKKINSIKTPFNRQSNKGNSPKKKTKINFDKYLVKTQSFIKNVIEHEEENINGIYLNLIIIS